MVLSYDATFYIDGIFRNYNCHAVAYISMTKINTIYLDMDGVFTNFDAHWLQMFGRTPRVSRENKEFSSDWEEFIRSESFSKLPWTDNGKTLFDYITSLPSGIKVEMLTSSGGKKFHDEVTEQKIIWLCNNGFPWKANVVPGRGLKKNYASPSTILVDDTYDVIESFYLSGGHSIWHKDSNVNSTIWAINQLLITGEIND